MSIQSSISKISSQSTISDSKSMLFHRNPVYKPFRYHFAYEAFLSEDFLC